MTLPVVALFLVLAFVAEVIGTMAGFGAATILTPVASLFMDIKTAVALVAFFHLFGNSSRWYFFRPHVQWRLVLQFGIAGVAASFLGAQVASWLSPASIRVVLGIFLILFAVLEFTGVFSMRVPARLETLLIGGILSGFVAGLIGTGGAIRSVSLLAFGLPKEAYIGTSAVIALLVDATRLPVYLARGFLPLRWLPLLVVLTAVAFCGSWLGQRLIRQVSPVRFRRFVLLMLCLMGIKLLADGVRDSRRVVAGTLRSMSLASARP